MRRSGKVNQQVPHQMMMTERLHSVEDRTDGVEHTAQSYEKYKLPRGVAQKEREEEDYGPAHNKVNREADSGDRASA